MNLSDHVAPNEPLLAPVLRLPAKYERNGLPLSMHGNPLLEALRFTKDAKEYLVALSGKPDIDLDASRSQDPLARIYDLRALKQLFVPYPNGAMFARAIDVAVRDAYADRNPFNPAAVADLYSTAEILRAQSADQDPQYGGIFLEGMSGMGKTRLIRRILSMYPQAIVHANYSGRAYHQTQVVWLSVTAPVAGSLKGLMLSLMRHRDRAAGVEGTAAALYPQYAGKKLASVEVMLDAFCAAAASDQLGILHIDDFQRVAESRANRVMILQFIINLSNAVKCPILFSGTPATLELLKNEKDQNALETARRLCSSGHFKLRRPASHEDPFFGVLAAALFKYQWVDKPLALDDTLLRTLYELTAGLPSVLTFLHRAAQRRVLESGKGALTVEDYGATWTEELGMLHRPLQALIKMNPGAEAQFEAVMRKVAGDLLAK